MDFIVGEEIEKIDSHSFMAIGGNWSFFRRVGNGLTK